MRKTKVKRPEKETATTARDEGHDSSLSGAPSAAGGQIMAVLTGWNCCAEIRWQTAQSYRKLKANER